MVAFSKHKTLWVVWKNTGPYFGKERGKKRPFVGLEKMYKEKDPMALWSDNPSTRAVWASIAFFAVIFVLVWWFAPFIAKAIYEAAPGLPFWSVETILWTQSALKWLCLIPIGVNLWRVVVYKTTRYEVTNDRFLYHHGILVRVHDEIELQRVRDFRVVRPLFSGLLGLGIIEMTSRDDNHPEIKLGPFVDARSIQDVIRRQVAVAQKERGFRELETY